MKEKLLKEIIYNELDRVLEYVQPDIPYNEIDIKEITYNLQIGVNKISDLMSKIEDERVDYFDILNILKRIRNNLRNILEELK